MYAAVRLSLLSPIIGAFFAIATLHVQPAHAQVARIEVHPLQSMTLTDQEFLTGRQDGPSVIIAGVLRLPHLGTDRMPAVVLVHGSGGVIGQVELWAHALHAMGVATFTLDSFTGRKLVSVVHNQAQLGRLAMIIDAYRALELLVTHPRIDPERIAVMGFSRGGQAALYASLKRFQRLHNPADGREFAAYLAFYPTCNTTYISDEEVTDKPIRLFHGTADNYVAIAPCRSYVERLRKHGKDVQLAEYPEAHHVFDWPLLKTAVTLAQATTTRQCSLEEGPAGHILNRHTRQPFRYEDPCVEHGPTLAYNAQAHTDALRAVREFVATRLKPESSVR